MKRRKKSPKKSLLKHFKDTASIIGGYASDSVGNVAERIGLGEGHKLRRNVLGLFLGSAAAIGGYLWLRDDPRIDALGVPEAHTIVKRGDTVAIATTDFDKQMTALKQKVPKTHALMSVRSKTNRYLLQTSAMENGCPNIFTVDNVMNIADILMEDKTASADGITIGIFDGVEGRRVGSYKDSFNYNSSGHGIFLPAPGDPRKQHLIQLIRDATPHKSLYIDIYKGKVSLDPAKIDQLTTKFLEEGGYKDMYRTAIANAIRGSDLNAEEKKEIDDDDLNIANVPVRYQALMTSMIWQTYSMFERNPALTGPALRVLCSKDASEEDKLQAMDDINFFYMDECLLKNFKEEKMENRKNLVWRALIFAAAIRMAMENPQGEEARRESAMRGVPQRYIASIIKAMQRDQGKDALIVQMGNLSCEIGKILLDPACGWEANTSCSVVVGGVGAIYKQKNDGDEQFWMREFRWPVVGEEKNIEVEFSDVVEDAVEKREEKRAETKTLKEQRQTRLASRRQQPSG